MTLDLLAGRCKTEREDSIAAAESGAETTGESSLNYMSCDVFFTGGCPDYMQVAERDELVHRELAQAQQQLRQLVG